MQGSPYHPGISALVLCAGRSRRMGGTKPLLKLGSETLIERAVGICRAAGVEDILAVLGHDAARVAAVADRIGARWTVNNRYGEGMFTSVQEGAVRLDGTCRAFFLLPVDIPLVRPDTLTGLIKAFAAAGSDAVVCRPVSEGRRGHPPLISSALIPEILGGEAPDGMRSILARHEGNSVFVECGDPWILFDIDTPDDLEKAREQLAAASRI
ncbi:MAG TPA: nucleotidyltransferase family protein [Syntrophales bacterium]|nr:nucleotidyltransferase family protein [Syntrophales bacterium]